MHPEWCLLFTFGLVSVILSVIVSIIYLLSPFQCEFRSNHTTEFAAVAFSDFIRRGMEQGLLLALFIVLRKAFDSVDHNLLINKLESYGLTNTELNWFKSYLSDRKQVVSVGKET